MSTVTLTAARRRVARRFTSTVRITSAGGGEPYWDPVTEQMVTPSGSVHYDGPASVRLAGRAGRVVDAVGDTIAVRGFVVSLPGTFGAPLPEGTRVEVTASRDTPDLVGTVMAVLHADLADNQVTRRLLCEATSG